MTRLFIASSALAVVAAAGLALGGRAVKHPSDQLVAYSIG